MLPRFAELKLTPEALQVLKDSGILDLDSLAQADVSSLQNAFIHAVKDGRYPEKSPSLVTLAAWVQEARTLAASPEQTVHDLDAIPTAVVKPSPAQRRSYAGSGPNAHIRTVELRQERLRPSRTNTEPKPAASGAPVTVAPRGEDLSHVVEELNPDRLRALHTRRSASTTLRTRSQEPPQPSTQAVSPADLAQPAPGFRSFDDYKEGRVPVKPLDRHSIKTGEDPERSTGSEQESFEEEQVYKKRMPIWRPRGVRHPDGMAVYRGAFITFLTILSTATLALGSLFFPFLIERFRTEAAIFFGSTILLWGVYVITAINLRCRVCSCHLFYSRRCLKNKKAHRILGGFPMFAQTLHILAWRWFRCMYCGTAIRLKDPKNTP